RPDRYEPEGRLCRELEVRRGAIWGHLLTRLGEIADHLADTTPPMLPSRMADFAAFGWQLFEPLGQADAWLALLRRVETVQGRSLPRGTAWWKRCGSSPARRGRSARSRSRNSSGSARRWPRGKRSRSPAHPRASESG